MQVKHKDGVQELLAFAQMQGIALPEDNVSAKEKSEKRFCCFRCVRKKTALKGGGEHMKMEDSAWSLH